MKTLTLEIAYTIAINFSYLDCDNFEINLQKDAIKYDELNSHPPLYRENATTIIDGIASAAECRYVYITAHNNHYNPHNAITHLNNLNVHH